MCVSDLPVCMCMSVHHIRTWLGVEESQETELGSLELEF